MASICSRQIKRDKTGASSKQQTDFNFQCISYHRVWRISSLL